MSVLKGKRNVSTAEYVKLASDIFDETLQFISRVSNRYVRLIGPDIMHLAGEVEDNCDAANRVNPKTKGQFEYRERHLLEALGATSALDVRMSKVYRIMMKRTRRKLIFFHNNPKFTPDDIWNSVQSSITYFGKYNDHKRLLKIHRLVYALFGWHCSSINDFRGARE